MTDEELLKLFKLDHLPLTQADEIKSAIMDYRQIWSEHPYDIGCHATVQQHIELEKELPPCPKQRIWPRNRQQVAEELIDTLEKYGIVSKSNSNWATNVILVSKAPLPSSEDLEKPLLDHFIEKSTIATPTQFRMVLDLRPTNSVTKDDKLSVGYMDNLLTNIAGKKFRSSFDFSQGFFQIALTPESKGVTFFVTRKSGSSIMKFNRMIQGSKNGTSVWTRAMEVTFKDLTDIVTFFVDDLLVHTTSFSEHVDALHYVKCSKQFLKVI